MTAGISAPYLQGGLREVIDFQLADNVNASKKKLTLLIVDDNKTYRSALKKVIDEYPQISEVAEAGNADEMFAQIGDEPPDIVIMDVSMPGMDGFDATEKLLSRHSSVKVIILTIYDTDEYRKRAKESGAIAYIPKQDAAEQLDAALHSIFGQKSVA